MEQTTNQEDEVDTVPAEDPFAGAQEQDDPFANGEGPQTGQDAPIQQPDADGVQPQPEPPIVDKEGQPVEPPQGEPDPPQEPSQPGTAANSTTNPPDPGAGAQDAAGAAKGGKSEMRRYRLLYQTGEKGWEEAEWEEDGKPTRVIDARNADHARRLAWPILGRPENGVTVLPIPDSAWKPKRLQARTVPVREALEIV